MTDSRGAIICEDVYFAYQGKAANIFNGFKYQIPLNESTALLGLNGTGKTTLLLLLLGYLYPKKGQIYTQIDGNTLKMSEMNGSIGYLSQRENIPLDYTVQEFVLLGRAPHILKFNTPSKKDYEITKEIIDSLDLKTFAESKLSEISGGELQRVRIARTLAQEADIILMDEPMTHLDLKNKNYLNKLIKAFIGLGKTIIYSTHDPLDVLNFSDNCIIMGRNNRYIAGITEQIVTSKVLSEFFEIPIMVIKENGNKSIIVNKNSDTKK